ncbi:MAG: aminopeptidase P family protein [SAR202 cluster bacterium]|nr:aminopeptidase P family protein [SAR202 cluster bacterium]|tara:strand:+ start:3424 stop:4509 length:1086 start_codon:yes stop_codon:yes gene_type:complete
MNFTNRLKKLREKLIELNLDAILISSNENRMYFSGFRGSAGYLWITNTDAILATDFRYTEQAKVEAPNYQIIRIISGSSWLKDAVTASNALRVGIEDHDLTLAGYNSIKAQLSDIAIKPKLVSTGFTCNQLRAIKDSQEIDQLIQAINFSDQAIEIVGAKLKPGITEREISWELEKTMRELGADGLSFNTIVASGPNAAKAHHKPSERKLEAGDGVVIDMGALYQGYCSDITRTFVIGKASPEFRKIFDIVLSAQETAEATAKAGMTGAEIDYLARQVIDAAGYENEFGHSLGHGIGIAVHELPGVGPNSINRIENGMVFSIEPGIYIEGWGGVRIEDLVLMENDCPRVLTKAHKRDLVEI